MIKHKILITIITGLVAALPCRVALTQETPPAVECPGSAIPLALTIRGGSSLGAYEAGFLYMVTELIKLNPDRLRLPAVTGSSAGAINALLTAMAMGTETQSDPTRSRYYSVWTGEDLSYQKLLDTDAAPAGAFSSRSSMHDMARKVKKGWLTEITKPFELTVGITATRENPMQQKIGELTIKRQEEQFAFLISNDGPGGLEGPRIQNQRVTLLGAPPQPMLPLEQNGPGASGRQFDTIMDLLYASSAFPLVFPPQKIAFCLSDKPEGQASDKSHACKNPNATEYFIDGGLFDNSPEGLAVSMARGNPRTRFLFIDPTNPNYLPEASAPEPADEPETWVGGSEYSFFLWLIQLDASFISDAQSTELHNLAVDHPEVLPRLHVSSRNYPVASGLMGNFMGFFEADFRKFDFYLGMYDAEHLIENALKKLVEKELKHPKITGDGRAPYNCMTHVFKGKKQLKNPCKAEGLYNFDILVRAAVMRRAAAEKDRDAETDLTLFVDFLEKNHFLFKDLGLSARDADRAMLAMRNQLAMRLDSFNAKLQWAERMVMNTISIPALNFFYYASPDLAVYAVVGNAFELGLSKGLSPHNIFRINAALSMKGFFTLGWEEPVVTFTAAVGPQFELIGTAAFQLRTSLRFGYQVSTYGGFTTDTCDLTENSLRCSAPVAQIGVAMVLLSRVRLQLGLDWSPPWIPDVPPEDDHLLSFMIALGWQWLPGA